MPLKFIPGTHNTTNQILKYALLYPDANSDCRCIQEIPNTEKKNLLYPPAPINLRIAQVLNSSLGGRIRFGDIGAPIIIDAIGRREGQPGGVRGPLRNKF